MTAESLRDALETVPGVTVPSGFTEAAEENFAGVKAALKAFLEEIASAENSAEAAAGLETLNNYLAYLPSRGGEDSDAFTDYLAGLEANTASAPHIVPVSDFYDYFDSTFTTTTDGREWDWLHVSSAVQGAGKYVIFDLSGCTFKDSRILGTQHDNGYRDGDGAFNYYLRNNEFIKGIILPDTLETIGEYAFYDCTSRPV